MEADDEHDYPKVALDRMEGSLRGLLLRGGAFELAYGQDLDQASRALNEAAAHASDRGPRSGSADPALKKAEAQLGGWAVLGIEDDSRAYLQALREALRYASDKTKYPRKKGAKAKPSPPSPSTYELREIPVPASAGLPADALHFVLRSQPNPKYVASKAKPAAPPPGTIHVLAIADSAQHAWIALSADEAQVLARIQALLSPVSAKTLGASDELRQFEKQQRVAGLGFGTLAGFSALGLSAESKPKVLESRNTLKQLWSLPKRGATRMPIWITRAQSAKGSRRVTLHLRLTPDAIGDVLALFIGQSAE